MIVSNPNHNDTEKDKRVKETKEKICNLIKRKESHVIKTWNNILSADGFGHFYMVMSPVRATIPKRHTHQLDLLSLTKWHIATSVPINREFPQMNHLKRRGLGLTLCFL